MLADPSEAASFGAASWRDDLDVLWAYLTGAADPRPTDVLFCFGSFHFGVARHAATLFGLGVAPVVLVSGGAVGRIEPYETEAEAYVDILGQSGVPVDRIVVESRATNTGENVRFGMAALREHGVDVRSATLVAWPTSLRRCVATFEQQHPGVTVRTQPAFSGFGPYAPMPERAIETCLAELVRLRTYPVLGYIAAEAIPGDVELAAERLSRPFVDGPSVRPFAVAPPLA
jgi:uncharacterized SAM-binding protein YcdF (DUF218 family)